MMSEFESIVGPALVLLGPESVLVVSSVFMQSPVVLLFSDDGFFNKCVVCMLIQH